MLRRQGGGSHVIQADLPPFRVPWVGLFAMSHYWPTLATFLATFGSELNPQLLHKYGLAQVGFGLCYRH
jgi:hypothetical protein